ncbi:MAG: hypothetical protein GXN97_04280 [Aquificae bacterium]|nr:hypothetical protein [Aquificota bacterium]
MDSFLLVGGGAAVAVGALVVALILLKKGKKKTTVERKPYEEEEEEEEPLLPGGFKIEEEEETGCPPEIKQRLLKRQEKLYKDALKVYMVIDNIFQGRQIPPELEEDLKVFKRAFNRLKEMKEEIEVYPFRDCEKVFHLKFEFYSKLIADTARKLMIASKNIK